MAQTNHVPIQTAATKATERLSINVSHKTAQMVRSLAKAKFTTVTEVIRRAIAVLKLLEDEQAAGNEIHIVGTDDEGRKVTRVLHLI